MSVTTVSGRMSLCGSTIVMTSRAAWADSAAPVRSPAASSRFARPTARPRRKDTHLKPRSTHVSFHNLELSGIDFRVQLEAVEVGLFDRVGTNSAAKPKRKQRA